MKEIIGYASDEDIITLKKKGVHSVIVPTIVDICGIRHFISSGVFSVTYTEDIHMPIFDIYINGIPMNSIVDSFDEIYKERSILELSDEANAIVLGEPHKAYDYIIHNITVALKDAYLETRKNASIARRLAMAISNTDTIIYKLTDKVDRFMKHLNDFGIPYDAKFSGLTEGVFHDILESHDKLDLMAIKYKNNKNACYLIKEMMANEQNR